MTEPDPVAPLTQIGRQLQKKADELGLRMVTFSIVPDPSGTQHRVHATFVPNDDKPPTVESDPEFDSIMEAQRRYELEEKAKQAREELEQFRDKLDNPGKGFLDE